MNPRGAHGEEGPRGAEGAWGSLTSGPSPPSLGSGSRSSLMCLRERKRRCAASWLICLMLLSDSEATSLRVRGEGKGHRTAGVGIWHFDNSPAFAKGLTPAKMSVVSCSTRTTSWPLNRRILPTCSGSSTLLGSFQSGKYGV